MAKEETQGSKRALERLVISVKMTTFSWLLCRELKWKIGNRLSEETVEMEMGGRLTEACEHLKMC